MLLIERVRLQKLSHVSGIGLFCHAVSHVFVQLRSPSCPIVQIDGTLAWHDIGLVIRRWYIGGAALVSRGRPVLRW